jgi:site-specific recombinase XerD
MRVDWDDDTQTILIPEGKAVKNDAAWEQELTDEAAMALESWLDQRANMEVYDDQPEIWLNREGNPYQSGSLNRLLRNLVDEADISHRGRKLVWYSFRHSIGTYVYDEYQDLRIVAEMLRQKSPASADRYVHPTKELREEAARIM